MYKTEAVGAAPSDVLSTFMAWDYTLARPVNVSQINETEIGERKKSHYFRPFATYMYPFQCYC